MHYSMHTCLFQLQGCINVQGGKFIKAIKKWGRKSKEGEGKKREKGREGMVFFPREL